MYIPTYSYYFEANPKYHVMEMMFLSLPMAKVPSGGKGTPNLNVEEEGVL